MNSQSIRLLRVANPALRTTFRAPLRAPLRASPSTTSIRLSSQLTITDPLHIYQNKVASGELKADEAQLRVAAELQKLYHRLKDYTPAQDFQRKVSALQAQLLEIEKEAAGEDLTESRDRKKKITSKPWYKPDLRSMEMVKTLTDEEELINFNSPQGLLIHGEVGCGKSMLMDMFADSLPHQSKKRIHYNNFMLSLYGSIHRLTQERQNRLRSAETLLGKESDALLTDYILLELAQDMIDNHTVLLLDEFMLPDMAAAKIVKTLFIYYFKFGGVLVATSNRLPKDLYATNFSKTQFESFLTILQARCITHNMQSDTDYREVLSGEKQEQMGDTKPLTKYHVNDPEGDQVWEETIKSLCPSSEGKEEEILVYGRPLVIPWTKDGVAMFKFSQLIERPLAAADFISLASKYHTIIVDEVPVMTLAKKNEARRLITLLDAAYECRCQLIIRAEAGSDSLFFPEIDDPEKMKEEADIQAQEMYSDTLQDIENPHRPNVASYDTPTGQRESENLRVIKPTNFADTTAFTGEDEKFAYKRAVSRLKEMTQSPHWTVDKWMPLPDSDRPWEEFTKSESYKEQEKKRALTDEAASLASMGFRPPVKTVAPNAPKFNESHFWSMISWGDRVPKDEIAARWRKGVGAYEKEKK